MMKFRILLVLVLLSVANSHAYLVSDTILYYDFNEGDMIIYDMYIPEKEVINGFVLQSGILILTIIEDMRIIDGENLNMTEYISATLDNDIMPPELIRDIDEVTMFPISIYRKDTREVFLLYDFLVEHSSRVISLNDDETIIHISGSGELYDVRVSDGVVLRFDELDSGSYIEFVDIVRNYNYNTGGLESSGIPTTKISWNIYSLSILIIFPLLKMGFQKSYKENCTSTINE